MYGKDERRAVKKEFWTNFGFVMKPHLSSEGRRVKWVNYPTGSKVLRFNMDADQKQCMVSIDIRHHDPDIREIYWEQLLETRAYLSGLSDMEWTWEEDHELRSGEALHRVSARLEDVNIFQQEDWPRMYEFLKMGIRTLDEYWNDMRHLFDPLKD